MLKTLSLLTTGMVFTAASAFAGHNMTDMSNCGRYCQSHGMTDCGTSCNTSGDNFSGYYIGADVGIRYNSVGRTVIRDNVRNTFNDSTSSTQTQGTEGIHLGYGRMFCNIAYLGLDVFTRQAQSTYDYTDIMNDATTSSMSMKLGSLYGFNAVIGYPAKTNLMPYVAAGYELLNVKGSLNWAPSTILSFDKYVGGPDAGVGLRYAVTPRFSLNAEYNAAWFGSAGYSQLASGRQETLQIKPKYVVTATVGASYLIG